MAEGSEKDPVIEDAPVPEHPVLFRWRRYGLEIGVFFLVVLFASLAWRPLVSSSLVIARYPYQIDREEGFIYNQALMLMQGETIYPSLEDYPYTVGNYTPVYPALFGMVMKVSGVESLGVGRLLVLLSVLGIMGALFALVFAETRSVASGLLPPMLFLSTYDLGNWIFYTRVDLPAICFSLWGLFFFLRGKPKVWVPICAVLFTLAFYTKQTELLAPAAILFSLLIHRQWKLAGVFAGATAGLALVVGLLLIVVTGGEFWKHTVVYNANIFHWNQVWAMYKNDLWFFAGWGLIAGFVSFVILSIFTIKGMRKSGEEKESSSRTTLVNLTVIFFLVFSALSTLSVAKAGSAVNYFLGFHASWALIVGLFLGRIILDYRQGNVNRFWICPGAAILVFGILLPHFFTMNDKMKRMWSFPPAPSVEAAKGPSLLAANLAIQDDEILSEDPVLNIMARKEVFYQPFIMAQLAKEGKWDQSPFVEDLRQGKFPLLVSEKDLSKDAFYGFTEEMAEAIQSHYTLEFAVPFYPNQQRFLYRWTGEKASALEAD